VELFIRKISQPKLKISANQRISNMNGMNYNAKNRSLKVNGVLSIGKYPSLCKFIWKISSCYINVMLYYAIILILGHFSLFSF